MKLLQGSSIHPSERKCGAAHTMRIEFEDRVDVDRLILALQYGLEKFPTSTEAIKTLEPNAYATSLLLRDMETSDLCELQLVFDVSEKRLRPK